MKKIYKLSEITSNSKNNPNKNQKSNLNISIIFFKKICRNDY